MFYQESDAIVFVIDSFDKAKFYNVEELIKDLVTDPVVEKKLPPILFLAHKQDIAAEHNLTATEIQKILDIDEKLKRKKLPFIVKPSSAFG